MIKKKVVLFLISFFVINLCGCQSRSDSLDSSKSDLFILEINTDDLNNVYALATYTGPETVTVRHAATPILFKVYDENGKELLITVTSMIEARTKVNPGDVIRSDMGGFSPTGSEEFIYYVVDETGYSTERRYNYVSGKTYEFYAYFVYNSTAGPGEVKLETSVFVHIP